MEILKDKKLLVGGLAVIGGIALVSYLLKSKAPRRNSEGFFNALGSDSKLRFIPESIISAPLSNADKLKAEVIRLGNLVRSQMNSTYETYSTNKRVRVLKTTISAIEQIQMLTKSIFPNDQLYANATFYYFNLMFGNGYMEVPQGVAPTNYIGLTNQLMLLYSRNINIIYKNLPVDKDLSINGWIEQTMADRNFMPLFNDYMTAILTHHR